MNGGGPFPAFALLESRLPAQKGRKFYGTFQSTPDGEEYNACVARIESDGPEGMQLPTGVIPGGRYARRKLPDRERNRSDLPKLFQEMAPTPDVDPSRPSPEIYRNAAEPHLLVPVRSSHGKEEPDTPTERTSVRQNPRSAITMYVPAPEGQR
jgi:hypothetical protein